MAINIEGGISVGGSINIGGDSGGGVAGIDNVVGYDQMPPPVTAGGTVEDFDAIINSPIGFTITDPFYSAVLITGLSASNEAWFATYGDGPKTCTWGPGSTVASSPIIVVINSGTTLRFVIQGATGPATYNYPFTFS